ncbi:TadE family protein [Acidithiobacillus sp. IBUN Pt1247-S3]|uniref:TadE family protein n=1 Tax=Acidithiobacillus sp. IBUN Pt1247-S3 TaxID=3166642 RepID=UPI0034E3FBA4
MPRPKQTREDGQALVETVVVAGAVLVPLFLGMVYAGKWGFTQDRAVEAARYAAWERVVWRAQPPAGRQWTAQRSDDELRQDLTVRYFGDRNEKITADNSGAAQGSSSEPLLHKHDGKPLLTERERHITLATREEGSAMAGGLLGSALAAAKFGRGLGIEMSGPTVATVSVTLDGIPQRMFREVGLAQNLTFSAQAAVLTDPWSANGPAEAQKITQDFANPPQIVATRTLGQYAIKVPMLALRVTAFLLGGLFSETDRFKPSALVPVDQELQFGDRLQPRPNIPRYIGP